MRRLPVMLGLWMCVGCSAEQGATFQIINAPSPNTSCELSVTPDQFIPQGFYDPHGYGGVFPTSFWLGVLLRNNMIVATDDPVTTFGRDVRTSANDVELLGFNVCWDLASRHSGYGNSGDLLFECEAMPASQRAFISTSAWVAAGAGQSAVSVDVLSLEALQAPGIFGPNFFPMGLIEETQLETTAAQPAFSLPLIDAACPLGTGSACANTRSANWGDFPYVIDNTARILVMLRAVGRSQSGSSIESNWFTYPIDVCVGCMTARCGVPVYQQCTEDTISCADSTTPSCSDASAPTCSFGAARCNNGASSTCGDGSAARCGGGATAYVGKYLSLETSCLPFQNVDAQCATLACP